MQLHQAEAFEFTDFNVQYFPGRRTRLDFEIGNGNEHSAVAAMPESLPWNFCAPAERGGNGLRDTFNQHGFQNYSIRNGEIISRKQTVATAVVSVQSVSASMKRIGARCGIRFSMATDMISVFIWALVARRFGLFPERIKIIPLQRIALENGFQILGEFGSAIFQIGVALVVRRHFQDAAREIRRNDNGRRVRAD